MVAKLGILTRNPIPLAKISALKPPSNRLQTTLKPPSNHPQTAFKPPSNLVQPDFKLS
jgi:hypothetical protein